MNREVLNVLSKLAAVSTLHHGIPKAAGGRQHTYTRTPKGEMAIADIKAVGQARAKRERRAAARQRQVAAGGFRA